MVTNDVPCGCVLRSFKKSSVGSNRINQGAGFLRIFKVAFDRLSQLRVNDCPVGLENRPCRVRAKIRRKAAVKMRRNTASRFIRLYPFFFFINPMLNDPYQRLLPI